MSKITEGTKEKRTKIDSLRPPREIVSNTKARRQWLADQLAIVKATPERDGKIVGTGSYQEVSVYEVRQVAGRVRFRGICQCCGGSQVVDLDMRAVHSPLFGALVMHGYNRPGDGYLIGKCPGVGMAPLNNEKTHTESWSVAAEAKLVLETEALAIAEQAERAALHAFSGDVENGAYLAKPRWTINSSRPEKFYTDAEKAILERYKADLKVWAKTYPLTHRYQVALANHQDARNNQWKAQRTAEHFRTLLASGTFGTELEKEVVT